MKKNFSSNFILILTVLLLVIIFTIIASAEDDKSISDDGGFVNVDDYGALSDDGKDDYDAFVAALSTGKNLYIPNGTYHLSKTIVLDNRICKGTSSGYTCLKGLNKNIDEPIMIAEGCSSVSDIYFSYDKNDITGNETMGERVALQIGEKDKQLNCGSALRNLYFDKVGTAIYCPTDSSCSGVLFETIEVVAYSYRGFDMQGENRLNNTYSNVYINTTTTQPNISSGFALEGSEIGAVVNQLNIEHDYCKYPIIFRNVKGLNVSAIHIEGVCINQSDMGYIYSENTSGYIANLTAIFTYIAYENNSLICFGNGNNDSLIIGCINLRGLNMPDKPTHPDWREAIGNDLGLKGVAASFRTFGRTKNATGNYNVKVKNYAYYTYADDYDIISSVSHFGNLNVTAENHKEANS